jgi:hypothetical protein
MGDFATEGPVVHEENIEVLCIVNNEFLKPVGKEELGSVVRAISDFRHLLVASESSSHAIINA